LQHAVIRYDLSEVMDDISTLTALHIVIGTSLRDNRIGSIVDPKLFLLFGHRYDVHCWAEDCATD